MNSGISSVIYVVDECENANIISINISTSTRINPSAPKKICNGISFLLRILKARPTPTRIVRMVFSRYLLFLMTQPPQDVAPELVSAPVT